MINHPAFEDVPLDLYIKDLEEVVDSNDVEIQQALETYTMFETWVANVLPLQQPLIKTR
jgi:hypothetical protein